MKVKQLHLVVNAATEAILGETAVLQEDLSNIVDVGKLIIDSDKVDNYVKNLVNHIGKVIFVDRIYQGGVPTLLMDSWEYGSILEKVSAELEAKGMKIRTIIEGPDVQVRGSIAVKNLNDINAVAEVDRIEHDHAL